MAATLTPLKGELRGFLNNGSTSTGAIKTVTLKFADLNKSTMTSMSPEQAALLLALTTAAIPVLSKAIYYSAVISTSQLENV